MLLNRRFHMVKKGFVESTAALVVADLKKSSKGHAFRVCGPVIAGPFDAVAIEIEFKDLQDYESFWAEREDSQEYADFRAKFWEMTAPGGHNEIWVIAE